ncbi:STAS domain-containing protein [Actinomadura graeca]|uniref:STAS domain-containing protein n=1 Tax=Actinomadura graeca TaxID=2750812 RepID=A0ABX8QXQ9_9ACTN|nr:STAS domain-containing protein [Actinomadura graeca]QXJ22242.1 STAS domain-containing protein [Actinomadura graeca]
MTAHFPDTPLRLVATASGSGSLRIEIRGDLDFFTAGSLQDAVEAHLDGRADELELDCAGLGVCDSAGLAALLMVRRRADAAGVRLRMTGRSARLDRMLDLTGTLRHLTGEPAADAEDGKEVRHSGTKERSTPLATRDGG